MRSSFAWAPVRSSPEVREWMFPSAYHIKVAVRDSTELWLSSGNWNNSNQPEDAPHNRSRPGARRRDVQEKRPRLARRHRRVRSWRSSTRRISSTTGRRRSRPRAASAGGRFGGVRRTGLRLAETQSGGGRPGAARLTSRRSPVTEQMTIQPLLTPDRGARRRHRDVCRKDAGADLERAAQPVYPIAIHSSVQPGRRTRPSPRCSTRSRRALRPASMSASSSANGRTANGWNGCRRPASTPGSSASSRASTTRALSSTIRGS